MLKNVSKKMRLDSAVDKSSYGSSYYSYRVVVLLIFKLFELVLAYSMEALPSPF